MKRPHFLVKAGVILSSVLLVGGLVAYRSGAFDRLRGNRPTMMDGSKTKELLDRYSRGAPTDDPADRTMMSSSKLMILTSPSSNETPVDVGAATSKKVDASAASPTFMLGSKSSSIPIIVLPQKPEPETKDKQAAPSK